MDQEPRPDDVCCPKFEPAPWDNQTLTWDNKLFIKDSIPTFFHIPLPSTVGKLMTRMWSTVEKAGAKPEKQDFICMANDPSLFRSEYYMAVTKEVPGAENVRLSGDFMTKVFDGPYSAVPKWIKEMNQFLGSQDKKALKYYFYYTTCPKCAKKYGHNYVVAFAQVA